MDKKLSYTLEINKYSRKTYIPNSYLKTYKLRMKNFKINEKETVKLRVQK